jgi:predicted methyltransferase
VDPGGGKPSPADVHGHPMRSSRWNIVYFLALAAIPALAFLGRGSSPALACLAAIAVGVPYALSASRRAGSAARVERLAVPPLALWAALSAQGVVHLWLSLGPGPPLPIAAWHALNAAATAGWFLALQRTCTLLRRALVALPLAAVVLVTGPLLVNLGLIPAAPVGPAEVSTLYAVVLAPAVSAAAVCTARISRWSVLASVAAFSLGLASLWTVMDRTFLDFSPGDLEPIARSEITYWDLTEHPARAAVEHPDDVLAHLPIEPGMRVADFGSAAGFFTFPLARAVGPTGRVFAVDIAHHGVLLERFQARMARADLNPYRNVVPVRNTPTSIALPEASVDLVFVKEVGLLIGAALPPGEIDGGPMFRQVQTARSIHRALKPGGWLAAIDLVEDPRRPIRANDVQFSYAQDVQDVVQNYERLGFTLVSSFDTYADERHRACQEELRRHGDFPLLDEYLIGRTKFFLLFRKGPPTAPDAGLAP